VSSPLDEDAPALARVAVQAVTVLNDATADSVDYPGLSGPRDIEAVLSALARLSGELQETATHLDDYLSDQLRGQRLEPAKGSSQTPVSVVSVAGGALAEVRDAAAHMSTLLTAAELAMLAVAPSDHG
jgi:spore maturation protein SpmB